MVLEQGGDRPEEYVQDDHTGGKWIVGEYQRRQGEVVGFEMCFGGLLDLLVGWMWGRFGEDGEKKRVRWW